jgi:hypothetical protein
MLRSIVIGFAVAALLQIGVRSAAPAPDLAYLTTWSQIECEAAAFTGALVDGVTSLVR